MATKVNTVFVCDKCGFESVKWLGKCPDCGAWNSFVEEIRKQTETEKKENKTPSSFIRPEKISAISDEHIERIKSGIDEFDRVLGGGIVPSEIVLIGGDPGIGKSTILTSVAGNLSKNYKVLYVSAEESCSQVKIRAKRLGVNSDNLFIMNENSLENVESVLDGYDFLIIDSIQAIYSEEMSSSAGSVGQVRECSAKLMRLAKSKKITTFIVGHITKEGSIAGPKVLEHNMDCVLYFEGEEQNNYRILRAVKNRFGSVNEVGVFEMREDGLIGVKNYSGIFISENRKETAGSVVTPYVSGNRCVPVEIQSLVSKTVFGMPRRMSLGIDYNKLVLLIAVLEKKAGLPFYSQDVYLNAMGGIKLTEPSVDLAIVMSLASGITGYALDPFAACFGEVGLSGEVRAVGNAEKRIKECINMGFKKVYLPKANAIALKKYSGDITLIPVSYVYQAVNELKKGNIKESE